MKKISCLPLVSLAAVGRDGAGPNDVQDSERPQVPFYGKASSGNSDGREQRTQLTIETAQLILKYHGSMAEASIQTAETTARLVNTSRIDMGLLLHMTTPTTNLKQYPLERSVQDLRICTELASTDEIGEQVDVMPPSAGHPTKAKKSRKRDMNKSETCNQENIENQAEPCCENATVDDASRSHEITSIDDETPRHTHTPALLPDETCKLGAVGVENAVGAADQVLAQQTETFPMEKSEDSHAEREVSRTKVKEGSGDVDAKSKASLEWSYTPPNSRNTSPTDLARGISAQNQSLKQELVSEEAALHEETTKWNVTPEQSEEPAESEMAMKLELRPVSSTQLKLSVERANKKIVHDLTISSPALAGETRAERISCAMENFQATSVEPEPDTIGTNNDDIFGLRAHTSMDHVSEGRVLRSELETSRASPMAEQTFIERIKEEAFSTQKVHDSQVQSFEELTLRYYLASARNGLADETGRSLNAHLADRKLAQRCNSSPRSCRRKKIRSPKEASGYVFPGRTSCVQDENRKHHRRCLVVATRLKEDHTTSEQRERSPQLALLTSGSGPQELIWSYITHTPADQKLRDAGVWLWDRPPTYLDPMPLSATQRDGIAVPAPAIVERNSIGNPPEPQITFEGNVVRIVPHFPPWPDMRSDVKHPDFLPWFKLGEYQACEVAGYRVWRHDRDFLSCARRYCGAVTSDYDLDTRVCVGCGPKTTIRYCSREHELEDLKEHWKHCGDPNLVMQCIIDHATAPSFFNNLRPRIEEIHGVKSFALHRQRHFAGNCQGRYTLFDQRTEEPTTLSWPKTHLNWQEMDSRIERLLNIAFFDIRNHCMLRYLYSLLHHIISITRLNCPQPLETLKSQFGAEFGRHVLGTLDREPIFPCDCEWYGQQLDQTLHLQSCQQRHESLANLVPERGSGLLRQTMEMETRYWILRAWAQQHPTIRNWRYRATGMGFEIDSSDQAVIRLGPGFVGWGADANNICS